MSVGKKILSYNNTGRELGTRGNTIHNVSGIFLTKKSFRFTEDDLLDYEYFFNAFNSGNIFPLHYILDFNNQDKNTVYEESQQDYFIKLAKTKYRHSLEFNWSDTFHELVSDYSDSDLYVIYYDSNKNIIAVEDNGVYRGFKTDRITIEEQKIFISQSEKASSIVDIDIKYGEKGNILPVSWMPTIIDKLFINIQITSLDSNNINFIAKYNTTTISDIISTDVSIYDNVKGNVNFNLFNITEGIYKLSGFNKSLTNGCLIINSYGYLGKQRYVVKIKIPIEASFLLLDDDDFILLDDDGFDLLTVTEYFPIYNAGYSPATDWINSINGLADGWSGSGSATRNYNIINGSGFNGNAQSIKASNYGSIYTTSSKSSGLQVGYQHSIKFKYKSTINFTIRLLQYNGSSVIISQFNVPINSTSVIENSNIIIPQGNEYQFMIIGLFQNPTDEIIIDEIRLEKEY